MIDWIHQIAVVSASFSASLVECVEALTIVVAVGVSRGWRSSLLGVVSGLIVLCLLVLGCWPLFTQNLFPLAAMQVVIGIFLLLFGLRWLRKAILRMANIIPLHDEAVIFKKQITQLGKSGAKDQLDLIAFITSLKAVLIEGVEVVFIIVAMGATETSFVTVSLGAVAALVVVVLGGVILHGPLTRIPENTLKFGVSVILSAFGLYWIGEGSGLHWPGGDLSLPGLVLFFLTMSLLIVINLKKRTSMHESKS